MQLSSVLVHVYMYVQLMLWLIAADQMTSAEYSDVMRSTFAGLLEANPAGPPVASQDKEITVDFLNSLLLASDVSSNVELQLTVFSLLTRVDTVSALCLEVLRVKSLRETNPQLVTSTALLALLNQIKKHYCS